MKRKALSGRNAGDKRSFRNCFDMEKLSKDTYFCDTLEPTWRNLKGIDLKPEEVDARYSRQSGKVARKIPGHTAIPEGSYRVLITLSPRFKEWLPYVQGVGENRLKGMVVNSRIWLHRLMKRIREVQKEGEAVWITIV